MRKRTVLLTLILFAVISLLVWAKPVLMQEDNTVSVLSGIIRLSLSESEIIQYDEDDQTLYYISKSSLDENLIASILPEESVLSEQMGSGYIFTDKEDPSSKTVVTGTQFSRFYRIWKVMKNQ